MLGMRIVVATGLLALTAASPMLARQYSPTSTTSAEACPTVCIDKVKTCPDGSQIKYGGCFPQCLGDPFPTPPEPTCPSTAEKRQDCPTVCIDKVKTCPNGSKIKYGGCFPQCPGEPLPAPPEPTCPPTAEKREDCPIVCHDLLKICPDGHSIKYGGCFPQCSGEPFPAPEPTCTVYPEKRQATPTAAVVCPRVCVDKLFTCPDGSQIKYGGCFLQCPGLPLPPIPEPTCPSTVEKRDTYPAIPTAAAVEPCESETICIDAIKKCPDGSSIPYGGCITLCRGDPIPKPLEPTCPVTAEKRQTGDTTCPTVCIHGSKLCPDSSQVPFGGCFPVCEGESFPDPICPA